MNGSFIAEAQDALDEPWSGFGLQPPPRGSMAEALRSFIDTDTALTLEAVGSPQDAAPALRQERGVKRQAFEALTVASFGRAFDSRHDPDAVLYIPADFPLPRVTLEQGRAIQGMWLACERERCQFALVLEVGVGGAGANWWIARVGRVGADNLVFALPPTGRPIDLTNFTGDTPGLPFTAQWLWVILVARGRAAPPATAQPLFAQVAGDIANVAEELREGAAARRYEIFCDGCGRTYDTVARAPLCCFCSAPRQLAEYRELAGG